MNLKEDNKVYMYMLIIRFDGFIPAMIMYPKSAHIFI